MRAQHYRDRLKLHEAPIPLPDDALDRSDRRARARDWSRSSSARRGSGGWAGKVREKGREACVLVGGGCSCTLSLQAMGEKQMGVV